MKVQYQSQVLFYFVAFLTYLYYAKHFQGGISCYVSMPSYKRPVCIQKIKLKMFFGCLRAFVKVLLIDGIILCFH